MSYTQAVPQILLVAENLEQLTYATTALANWNSCEWNEVRDCAAAVEWLRGHSAHIVVTLLQSAHQPAHMAGLELLRQSWHGPLICLCDDDEQIVSAVEAVQGLAILPPFAPRQIRSALNYARPQIENPERQTQGEAQDPHALHYRNERRLEQAQRMELVGRLAGGITHDFNNLLSVIGSYGDLAIRKLEEGHAVRLYVEQIRKANAIAATLTRQLLNLSRRQELQSRAVVLNEVVDEISVMVQSLLGAGIELRMRLDPELGQIEADPGQLQQVLLNLIVNAKDAMPEGGLLNIETRNYEVDACLARQHPNIQPGSYVRLTVADTGIGIDSETVARIYEPFFTTKPKGSGTGLGLSTVYSIVQQIGGYICVHSDVGQATTFHIYLPRVDVVFDTKAHEAEITHTLHGSETILLVEHERPMRDFVTTILQEAGYQVLAAEAPEEALSLEIGYHGEIDLLLTNVIMPQMQGREVATQLARRRPDLRVVYVSGYTQEVLAFKQLLDKDAHWVEKPFYPNELLRAVRGAIEQVPVYTGLSLPFTQSPLSDCVNVAL
jgi:signal transduction histidine kinase/CheY-like chemotaxis protein